MPRPAPVTTATRSLIGFDLTSTPGWLDQQVPRLGSAGRSLRVKQHFGHFALIPQQALEPLGAFFQGRLDYSAFQPYPSLGQPLQSGAEVQSRVGEGADARDLVANHRIYRHRRLCVMQPFKDHPSSGSYTLDALVPGGTYSNGIDGDLYPFSIR